MPVRYVPLLPVPEKEFVEPNASDYFIWWLFRGRCVVCHQPAEDVNEIILRSKSKKAALDWTNRVLLCRNHHTGQDGYHKHGVNEERRNWMREKRIEALKTFGREEYINYILKTDG